MGTLNLACAASSNCSAAGLVLWVLPEVNVGSKKGGIVQWWRERSEGMKDGLMF